MDWHSLHFFGFVFMQIKDALCNFVERQWKKSIFVLYVCMVLSLIGLQFVVFKRVNPGPDSIEYLEMADQIGQVGYLKALSGHWSPLYSLYCGLIQKMFHVTLDREVIWSIAGYAFLLFVAALTTLLFVLSLCPILWKTKDCITDHKNQCGWLVYLLGFSVYLFFVVHKIHLRLPDVLTYIFGILAALFWCKFIFSSKKLKWLAAAGVCSGIGFYARDSILPWSVVSALLACVFLRSSSLYGRGKFFIIFLFIIFLTSGPQIALLSAQKGHLTIGAGKIPMAEIYGAKWRNGFSSWPVRKAGGKIRIFTENRQVNFPGFYEPGREFDDAVIPFSLSKGLRGILRAFQSMFFGFWSSGFSLLWPLLWASWPFFVFGFFRENHHFQLSGEDASDNIKPRLAWFLILSGLAGITMHLLSFCIGYYLSLYLVLFFAGISMLCLKNLEDAALALTRRAHWVAGIGFILVAFLTTFSFFRDANMKAMNQSEKGEIILVDALNKVSKPSRGLRRIAVAGSWLGLYAIRLSDSQVYAEFPDVSTLYDNKELVRCIGLLKDEDVRAILAPSSVYMDNPNSGFKNIKGTPWSILELEDVKGVLKALK